MNDWLAVGDAGRLQVGRFALCEKGVEIDGDPTFEEWQAALKFAQRCASCSMWWIGDLLNAGESRYGETYAQAMESTGLEYKTVANAKYVAEKVTLSRRRERLPFSHHAEVAAFRPDKQSEWLAAAESQRWTREELRQAIRDSRGEKDAPRSDAEVIAEFHNFALKLLEDATDDNRHTLLTGFFAQLETLRDRFAKE